MCVCVYFSHYHLLGLLKLALIESHRDGEDVNETLCHLPVFRSTLLSGIQRAHREHFFHQRVSHSSAVGHGEGDESSPSALPHWIWFTVTILPFLGSALSPVAFAAISVLCEEIQNPSTTASTSSDSGLGILLQGSSCVCVCICLLVFLNSL